MIFDSVSSGELLPQEIEDAASIELNDVLNRFLNKYVQAIFIGWMSVLAVIVLKCFYFANDNLSPEEEEKRRKEQRL